MKLKSKIKNCIIKKFIEDNKNKLDFREEELEVLYSMDSKKIIRKLNKMTNEQKEYILSPLKYTDDKETKEYRTKGIASWEIYKIIESQLEIVLYSNENIKNLPDLTKLYIALNLSKEINFYYQELYNHLVGNYIYCCKIKLESKKSEIIDYINVFTSNIEEWQNLLKNSNDLTLNSIYKLSPLRLKDIASYKVEEEAQDKKKHIMSHLIFSEKEDIEKINSLTSEDFIRILNLLIKNSSVMNKGQVKLALTALSCDSVIYVDDRKINILENLSSSIFYFLSRLLFEYENSEMIEKIYEDRGDELVQALSNTPSECLPYTEEILTEEVFLAISTISLQTEILKKLGQVGTNNPIRYYDIMKFLVGNNEKLGFLSYLMGDCISATLDFICTNDSKEVLKAKFDALEIIIKQKFAILNGPNKIYEKYIKYLSYELEEKELDEEKINQLQIRSAYFEKESFYTIFKDIERNLNKEEILKLLYQTQDLEKMKANYRFIHIAQYYDNEVQKQIIKRLKNTETGYASTQIINYISNSEFLGASTEKQKSYLESLKISGENAILSEQDFTIEIPNYQYLKNFMIENNVSLTFKNIETGKEIILNVTERGKIYKKAINHNKNA